MGVNTGFQDNYDSRCCCFNMLNWFICSKSNLDENFEDYMERAKTWHEMTIVAQVTGLVLEKVLLFLLIFSGWHWQGLFTDCITENVHGLKSLWFRD